MKEDLLQNSILFFNLVEMFSAKLYYFAFIFDKVCFRRNSLAFFVTRISNLMTADVVLLSCFYAVRMYLETRKVLIRNTLDQVPC